MPSWTMCLGGDVASDAMGSTPLKAVPLARLPVESFEAHYELQEEELGVGASGAVRAAVNRKTGQRVAVKTFHPQKMRVRELRNLRSEMSVLRTVSHPGVVQVENIFETEETVHIVMECLEGGELFDRIAQHGRMKEAKVAGIVAQLLSTLGYLHGQYVGHRDIKLENIMFTKKGGSEVKLIDFGFASQIGPSTLFRQRCGTIQYAAPEVLKGLPYDTSVDLWSLGSLVYTLLTGRPLYEGGDEEVIPKAVNGEFTPHKRFLALSKEARDFVLALLRVDPYRRMRPERLLRHPWLAREAPEAVAVALEQAASLREKESDKMNIQVFKDVAWKALTLSVTAICGSSSADTFAALRR